MSDADSQNLVTRYLAAFNASDHDAMMALVSDDVAHDLSEGGREIGKEKLRRYLAEQGRRFGPRIGDSVVMTGQDGTRAAAEFTLRGTYAATADGFPEASGQHFSVRAGLFLEIEGGLIARISEYVDRADLLGQLSGG